MLSHAQLLVAPLLQSQAGGAQSGAAGLLSMLPILGATFVVMYFVMIRPERKKQQEQQTLLSSLKRGDEVVLTSGIIGKIHALDDRTVTLDVADRTRLRVLKIAVSGPASKFLGTAGATANADGQKALAVAKDDADASRADKDKAESEKKSA